MAQGIMTGIGFLGAGAIIRDGLSIRGLTTAASIWITAAIGILVGAGYYFPAGLATVFTLGTLSAFRWMEARIPIKFYAHFSRALPARRQHGRARAADPGQGARLQRLEPQLQAGRRPGFFEYRMVIQGARASKAQDLTRTLSALPGVAEFSIVPTGD